MNPTIERLKLIFLGVFAVVNAGILVWTLGWAMPQQHCVEAHKWWDGHERTCAQPILTSDITGRMIVNQQARNDALRAIGRLPPPVADTAAAPKP
jgi:hypothetical protein